MPYRLEPFSDIWLFYRAEDDPGMWVGHSLFTDQIALGKSVLESYVALKRVIRALLAEAAENSKVRVFSSSRIRGKVLAESAVCG